MKRKFFPVIAGVLMISGFISPVVSNGQKTLIKKYLTELPLGRPVNDGLLQKYRMIAVYTNMDLYGKFMSKTKVSGDYTRGLAGDSASWKNVFISGSQIYDEPFSQGVRQDYMENYRYIPSPEMLKEESFRNFPSSPENIFARNLIWDMFSFEIFAWTYCDSLKINKTYVLPDITGQFDMADIGKYSHNKIMLTWRGISEVNNELCAVLEFNAIDNRIEMNMAQIKTKGTEQYWGTILISLKTKNIEHAVMYGGTIQEIEVNGLKDKFLVKTIRELEVNKIQ
ncbi:MAG: hypothetical protein MUO72_13315 [Bacteroidales bacterium]|nr:hypothetical protein [Bacteroidales bacterium]